MPVGGWEFEAKKSKSYPEFEKKKPIIAANDKKSLRTDQKRGRVFWIKWWGWGHLE